MTAPGGSPVDRRELQAFLRDIYRAGKVVGDTGREFAIRPHGLPEEHGRSLRDLAVGARAVHTLETGCGFGLASLQLCDAIAATGRPDARHIVIDPRQARFDNAGVRAMRDAGAHGLVEYIDAGPEFVLPAMVSEGRHVDLAFIDGDHRFEGAFLDLYFAHQLVKPGGLVVVDHVWMPAVRLAVSYFVTNVGLEVEPVDVAGRIFTGAPSFLRDRLAAPPKPRIAVLRRPVELPQRRARHFVPFADWETGEAPITATARAARRRLVSLRSRVPRARSAA